MFATRSGWRRICFKLVAGKVRLSELPGYYLRVHDMHVETIKLQAAAFLCKSHLKQSQGFRL
jgi:hypothetical protein